MLSPSPLQVCTSILNLNLRKFNDIVFVRIAANKSELICHAVGSLSVMDVAWVW
jgi:hypothetical protein